LAALVCVAGVAAIVIAAGPAYSALTTTSLGAAGGTTQALQLSPNSGTFATCSHCHARLDVPEHTADRLNPSFSHDKHLTAHGAPISAILDPNQASCEACHELPVHTATGPRRPTMEACYACHGARPGSRSREYCALCHPPTFVLRPASHTADFHGKGHAQTIAKGGVSQCFLCHEGDEITFCRGCHGLDIPHAADWVRTATGHAGGHVAGAYGQGATCVKCHANRLDPPGNCYGGQCHGS
jgi:hypothetical protein